MSVELLSIGDLYPFEIPVREGVLANFFSPNHQLALFFPGISAREEHDYRRGQVRVRLLEKEHLAVILLKFGGQPWVDAPFNAARIPRGWFDQAQLISTSPESEERLAVEMILVDTVSRKVRGLRLFTLSRVTSRRLQDIALRQRSQGYSDADFERQLETLYRHPTHKLVDMAARAAKG